VNSKRFSDTWGELAMAVLERAFLDLDISSKGFSTCKEAERKKWRGDARHFFENREYRKWAKATGIPNEQIEERYLSEKGDNDGR
jgi:hypothetical protein